jgi:hypothetical protein
MDLGRIIETPMINPMMKAINNMITMVSKLTLIMAFSFF